MVKLLQFWALIFVPCMFMLFLAWRFKMGDPGLVRRTSMYFVAMFFVLPIADYIVYAYVSKNLAKIGFLTFVILGTAVYFWSTARAVFMPRHPTR